jgi:TPR repeat protein
MLAAFLQYWTNPTYVRQDRHRIAASHLVDALITRDDAALLYDIFKSSSFIRLRRKKKSPEESFPRFAEQCLSAAAELGHIVAMRNFGNLLIDGIGLTQDQAKGEEWLYKAMRAGDIQSKTILGQRLLDGKNVPKNVAEGERLLREAAGEDARAKGILATRLLEGDGLQQNLAEGEQLLRELVDAGNQLATLRLAAHLLSGRGLQQDVIEGVSLLRQLVDEGNKVATIMLAFHLLNKPDADQDTEDGIRLLQHMTDAGDIPAMILLGNYLLDQVNTSVEQAKEGELLLKKAIDEDSQDAKYIYGHRLLHGNGLEKDPLHGQKILQELADAGHEPSMIALAEYLFNITQVAT